MTSLTPPSNLVFKFLEQNAAQSMRFQKNKGVLTIAFTNDATYISKAPPTD